MADVEFHKPVMNDLPLEGDINAPNLRRASEDSEISTLDEPVRETLMREARGVGIKFFHVIYPKESRILLRDWDLWGPLLLCVFMAMLLQGSSQGSPQFAQIFTIYWAGAVAVTLNIKLLGGNISFFQSVCVLGYCVFPLTVSLSICRLILIAEQTTVLFAIRFGVVVLGFGWSTFASTAFLSESQPTNRKALAMYPIFLFYFVISWIVISHTHS